MRQRAHELAAAFGLLTRLPVWRLVRHDAPVDFTRAVWAYPVVGAVIGLIAGGADTLALRLGFAPGIAALLTLAAQLLVTGALHEDGLADTADGFGGGRTRERKLEIMRDSRIGSYGAVALMLALALRGMAIAEIAAPVVGLVVAGAMARGAIVLVLLVAEPARKDGMASSLSAIPFATAAIALLVPLGLAVCLLPFAQALLVAGITALLSYGVARWSTRQIGGHTGDVLGATAVATECLVLTLLAR